MAEMDAAIVCWDAKYYYFNPRPTQMMAGIKTLTGIPNFPSYTSGHSNFSGAAATVLGYIVPEKASVFMDMANEAAMSRAVRSYPLPQRLYGWFANRYKGWRVCRCKGKSRRIELINATDSKTMKTEIRLHYTLRIAIAMCFIGHGSFGMITKEIWCNYFAVFGIGKVMAYTLMPWLGSFDILMGLIILVYPVRAIALWLLIWATITATLRPLSGEPFAELIERAGNFGVPLAFLILNGGVSSWKQLFTKVEPNVQVSARTLYLVTQSFNGGSVSAADGSRLVKPVAKERPACAICVTWVFASRQSPLFLLDFLR